MAGLYENFQVLVPLASAEFFCEKMFSREAVMLRSVNETEKTPLGQFEVTAVRASDTEPKMYEVTFRQIDRGGAR